MLDVADYQNIEFTFPIRPETYEYTVTATSGTYKMIVGSKEISLEYNEFPFAVYRKISESPIPDLADYDLIVSRETIAGGFKYTIKMYKPRANEVIIRSGISLVNVSLSAGSTIVQPTSTEANPTSWPTGTFSLAYGTVQLNNGGSPNFPLNAADSIKSAIESQGGGITINFIYNKMIIDKWAEKIRLLIEVKFNSNDFNKVKSLVPSNIQTTPAADSASVSRMPGGRYGESYPLEMTNSFIAEDKPTVRVLNNNVYAQLTKPLPYEISTASTPTVTSASLTGTTLTVGVTLPAAVTDFATIKVTVGNADCTGVSGTSSQLTCTMPTVGSGATAAEGGLQVPVLLVPVFGFSTATGVTGVEITYGITSVSPSTIAQSGDVPITVTGFGFPFKVNSGFTFKLCGVAVTLSKISNTELMFTAPAKPLSGCTTGSELEIQWTGTTAKTAALTYDASLDMSITSMSPVTASPV